MYMDNILKPALCNKMEIIEFNGISFQNALMQNHAKRLNTNLTSHGDIYINIIINKHNIVVNIHVSCTHPCL